MLEGNWGDGAVPSQSKNTNQLWMQNGAKYLPLLSELVTQPLKPLGTSTSGLQQKARGWKTEEDQRISERTRDRDQESSRSSGNELFNKSCWTCCFFCSIYFWYLLILFLLGVYLPWLKKFGWATRFSQPTQTQALWLLSFVFVKLNI